MKTERDIINALTKDEQLILKNVMTIEQSHLYINELKQNSTKEKEVIDQVVKYIEKVITNEN